MDGNARPVQDWRKQSFDFAADSTKQLITVATGVVTATVLFSKDLDAISRGFAYASWIAFIISVILGIAVLLNLSGNLNNAADGKYREPSVIASGIRILSQGQIGMFLAGIVLLFFFGYHAIQIPKGTDKSISVTCTMSPPSSQPIPAKGQAGQQDGGSQPGHPSASPPTACCVDYSSILRIVLLVVVGATLLVVGIRLKSFVPAFAGSAMLLMGLTPSIANNFKIGDLLKVDVYHESDHPRSGTETSAPTFKDVGLIMNYANGCADLEAKNCKNAQSLQFLDGEKKSVTQVELFENVCKEKGTVFVVGRTDRVPLRASLRRRYESNVGLAQDRAENVKQAVTSFCKSSGLNPPPLVTEVAGPRKTPIIQSRKELSPEELASEEDRSVELDSIGVPVGSSVPVQQEKYPGWVGVAALAVIALLAACMALSATTWSAKIDLLKGKFDVTGSKGGDQGKKKEDSESTDA